MKRLLYGIVGLVLLCLSAFFGFITLYVARSEVWPAIQSGRLGVETDTMILNIVWEGNEIYVLFFAYFLLAAGFAYGGYRLVRRSIWRTRAPTDLR